MVESQQQESFNQLRLNGRCAHGENRLLRENRRALRHRPDVSREAEAFQIVQEILAENAARAKIRDVVFAEMQVLDILDRLLQTRRDGKAALVRHLAEEQIEIGDLVLHAAAEVAVCHGQLIKVAEHGKIGFRFHRGKPPSRKGDKTPSLIYYTLWPRKRQGKAQNSGWGSLRFSPVREAPRGRFRE